MGICGAKPVKPGDGPQAAAQSAPPEPTFTDEQVKALHSTIRWSKPLEDIKKMIAACPDLINASDKGNGNTAIHLACQNGHFATVNYLIAEKAAVDAQNDTGNTALHMAVVWPLPSPHLPFLISSIVCNGISRRNLANQSAECIPLIRL